jgi:hypothetical protein
VHPASWYSMDEFKTKDTIYSEKYSCTKCNDNKFQISIGLEIPEDSETVNDISWFSMATKCVSCGNKEIVFEDETA